MSDNKQIRMELSACPFIMETKKDVLLNTSVITDVIVNLCLNRLTLGRL